MISSFEKTCKCFVFAAVGMPSAAINHASVTRLKGVISASTQYENGRIVVTPIKVGTIPAATKIAPGVSLCCFVSDINLTDFNGIIEAFLKILFSRFN
jgi:hypothetical protein